MKTVNNAKLPRTVPGLIFFGALILFMCAFSACDGSDYRTVDGAHGRFADTHGKWLLINYWAQWCKPCIKEMPELNRFQQQYRDRVLLLTVNYDGTQGQSLRRQIAKLGIELPVLLDDPAPRLGFPRPDTLPTTLVFDPHGSLSQTLTGAQTFASLTAAIGAQTESIDGTRSHRQ